jgi:hypothetical protein
MLGSDAVGEMLIQQMTTDARGAARAIITATNSQLSEEELHERVNRLIDYIGEGSAPGRARAWMDDDIREETRALGNRLTVLQMTDTPVFDANLLERVIELFPEASLHTLDAGPLTHPEITAEKVREVTAARTARR